MQVGITCGPLKPKPFLCLFQGNPVCAFCFKSIVSQHPGLTTILGNSFETAEVKKKKKDSKSVEMEQYVFLFFFESAHE